MAQSKIELILEMKERIRTNLNRAKDAVSQSTKDMREKLNHLKGTFVSAFAEMRNEIPIFDKAIRMLKNPITLVIGAVGALWSGMRKLGEFATQTKQLYQEEAEAGAKEGRCLALGQQDEQQSADTVHEQNDVRLDAEQNGNQNGCTEHSEYVLNTQRNQLTQRQLFLYLDDSFVIHSITPYI